MSQRQSAQGTFQDVTITEKLLPYLDFSSFFSLQLVNKHFHNAVPRGKQFCLLALRHLYGKETQQRMQLLSLPTAAWSCPPMSEQSKNAVVSPEKSWTNMPRWSLLCDHIFSLHSFFIDGTHVTSSLALAILRDFMLFLSTGNSPIGSTKEEIQALCADCGLLTCTATAIAIKVEEGLTAQWDTCPIPSRTYGNNRITRENIIRAERLLLGCLSMAIPICHFGQYSFPMRLQLIKAEEEYRHMKCITTNTLGMPTTSRSTSTSSPRLSLTYQKALLQFVHHAFARNMNYLELSADPAQQALCALVFTLALMSIVHNHLQSVATMTWGMNVLKQGLIAALLYTDVIRDENEPPRLALEFIQHCFDALVFSLQELHRLESHVLASNAPDETPRTRGQERISQQLSSEDIVLVTAYRTIFAPPYHSGQIPSPLSVEGSHLVTILSTISRDILKTSHTQVMECLEHTWQRLIE